MSENSSATTDVRRHHQHATSSQCRLVATDACLALGGYCSAPPTACKQDAGVTVCRPCGTNKILYSQSQDPTSTFEPRTPRQLRCLSTLKNTNARGTTLPRRGSFGRQTRAPSQRARKPYTGLYRIIVASITRRPIVTNIYFEVYVCDKATTAVPYSHRARTHARTCQSGQSVGTAHVGDAPLRIAVTEHDASRRPFTVHTLTSDPESVTMFPFVLLMPTDVTVPRCPGSSRANACTKKYRYKKRHGVVEQATGHRAAAEGEGLEL